MVKTYENIPSDILIILVWIVMTLIFVITPVLNNSFIRTILAIPMVIFIPGYVSMAVLFPSRRSMNITEHISLSVGLSIAIVSLLGLLLNATFEITLIPILVMLCIYNTIFAIIAMDIRRRLPEDIQFSIEFDKIYEVINRDLRTKSKIDLILVVAVILTIIIAIGMMYNVIITHKTGERFTEFYILNASSGEADNYNIGLNPHTNITVGIANHEYNRVNYTIQIILDKNISASKELSLDHNSIWKGNVTLILNKEENNTKIEFLLFKENNFTMPYMKLHLWTRATI